MLVQLSIRNIVLIDRLDLAVGGGLTVLTGETGAGKSILLDAFALALGGRGDGSLVRHGATEGEVSATFELPAGHPALAAAAARGLATEGDLILRRVQFSDGRTRAFVNDSPVSAQTLRALGAGLVEIHGQHDERALTDTATHRALLDSFGGHAAEKAAMAEAFAAWRRLEAETDEHSARLAAMRSEAEFLAHAHAELEKLAPRPGEEETLAARRSGMMQAEKVATDLTEAAGSLSGESSPISAMAQVLRRLDRRMAQAPDLLGPPVKALEAGVHALELARDALEAALGAAEFDPRELERVEERLFALRGAARKYSVAIDSLPALGERLAGDLAALAGAEARAGELAARTREARAAVDVAAAALSDARRKAAAALDLAVRRELAPLKLARARFFTRLDADAASPGADGVDRVEFWVETNPGARPGPLMRIASGGELARFMLALKVALADRGTAPTLVFDEIDTGVGGAVADAIGQRLARLAGEAQVLAVTHAPQVAARAASHFHISKDGGPRAKSAATRVAALDAASRREEIARMLAGATVTDEARAAAARLLEAPG